MKIALLALALLLQIGSGAQSDRPEPQRVVDNDEFMQILMKPAYAALENAVARPPADRQAWATIYQRAITLAELQNLLFIRNRVAADDPRWPRAAATVRQAATDLAAAALVGLRSGEAADYETVRTRYVAVSSACNACHQTFSREAPVIKP